MDKINSANWSDVFARTEQRVVFASERYSDVHFQFEEPGLASGFIKSVTTPGMRLTEFSLNAGKPFQLVDQETTETAESVFVLNGAADSYFHNLSSPLQLSQNHHNFQYNNQFGGEHIIGSTGFHAITITYGLAFLSELFQNDDNSSIGELASCVHSKKPYVATPKAVTYQGRIAEVLGTVRKCPFSGVTRYLFLESKMMELFVLQMQQAQTVTGERGKDSWTTVDKDRLHAVKDYIESSFLEDFSLKDLTYKFGLNEFKLKKGYKQLFQTTVFGHVHQLRMEKAKKLLRTNEMNVSEAAFFIGYDNVSSFCTEFKKRFGCSPGKVVGA